MSASWPEMQSFQLGRYSIVWLTFRCYSDEDDQWRSTAPNLKALASVFTEKTTMLQTSPRPIQTSSSSGFVHVNFRFDSHVLDCTVQLLAGASVGQKSVTINMFLVPPVDQWMF